MLTNEQTNTHSTRKVCNAFIITCDFQLFIQEGKKHNAPHAEELRAQVASHLADLKQEVTRMKVRVVAHNKLNE